MPQDLIARGRKASAPLGTATFVGLRALDPFLQYSILAHGTGEALIRTLGSDTFAQGPASNVGIALLDDLGLSPYRLILLGMAVGSSVKHIFWKLFIGEEEMSVGAAAIVGIFNTFFNSVSSLLFLARATSPAYGRGEGPHWDWPVVPLSIGAALFVVGITWETLSEIQRAAAKRKGTGKPYTGGLWSLSRHPNYLGYTLWRAGYALASGGWIWGSIVGGFFTWDFANRGVPTLEEYCRTRYADKWDSYTRKTPYKLFPYIY